MDVPTIEAHKSIQYSCGIYPENGDHFGHAQFACVQTLVLTEPCRTRGDELRDLRLQNIATCKVTAVSARLLKGAQGG